MFILLYKSLRHAALQNLKPLDKWVSLSNVSGKQSGEGNGLGGDYTDWIVSTKSSLTSFDFLYTGTACYSCDLWLFYASGFKYDLTYDSLQYMSGLSSNLTFIRKMN